jgi:tRNA U38,U39,U40 pseudouridine synthase TruA
MLSSGERFIEDAFAFAGTCFPGWQLNNKSKKIIEKLFLNFKNFYVVRFFLPHRNIGTQ